MSGATVDWACDAIWRRNAKRFVASVAAALTGWHACGAAAHVPIPLVEVSSVNEYYAKRGDTSMSARIAGVGSTQLDADVPLSRFVVAGLIAKDQFICVQVIHANNLYRAGFSFRNPGSATSLRVRFASRYWKKLDDRIAGALAIRAFGSQDNRCKQVGALLPAVWGEAPPGTGGHLLVNGGQADSLRLQTATADSIECTRLDDALGGRRIATAAFTHACPLKLVSADCGKEVDVAVQGSYGPTFSEPDRLRLRLPCPRASR